MQACQTNNAVSKAITLKALYSTPMACDKMQASPKSIAMQHACIGAF